MKVSDSKVEEWSQKDWQTSRGQKRWIFIDKIGKSSWTLLVYSRGHFFDSNEKSYNTIEQ